MINFEKAARDLQFQQQMESCEFPAAEFNHRAHLRLAYIYLTENNTEKSTELMEQTLHRFLVHNGADPNHYHVTITKAWILAVHHFMNKTGGASSADEFIDSNPVMLDTKIMMTHYSAELLFSDEARVKFIQPDLEPIPRYSEHA